MIDAYPGCDRIDGVTGVILAGGASRRMGSKKALLKTGETTLIELVYRTLAPLFNDVLIVTNSPEDYAFLPCRTVPDVFPDTGAIAGLHAGLTASTTERVFVAACDMPSLNPELIRLLCTTSPEADAVVPVNNEGLREPLHAVYARSTLVTLQEIIEQGDRSILTVLDKLATTLIEREVYGGIAGAEESFRNVNTPEEYAEISG